MSEEELEMFRDFLRILTGCKAALLEVFHKYGTDESCLNIDINLLIRVNDKIIQIEDGWEAME